MKTKRSGPGRPKGRVYPIAINCRLPKQHGRFLVTAAKNRGVKQSDIIRTAISYYMKNYQGTNSNK